MPRAYGLIALFAFACASTCACGREDKPTPSVLSGAASAGAAGASASTSTSTSAPATRVIASARDDAEKLYRTRCAMCHGEAGHGDGPTARVLQPKPRDFADKAFQASSTDEDLAKVIVFGGESIGKSATMPKSPELASKPEVVRELVKQVRTFGR